jgi:branched-chain amino acid transport system ATP-binding protein
VSALLEVGGITVRFGGILAVDDARLSADAGAVTGLIGPNGAGKTTLFNVITGVQPANAGTVVLDGHDITHLAPHRRARRGMARTFQRLELFWTLNVVDNVRVAAELARAEDPDAVTAAVLERVGISHLGAEPAGELPTGYARLVELARALASNPKVLLLDEPASGLNEGETQALGTLLRDVASDGLAVVLVEHDMSLVMETCHHVAVLDLGRVIAEGSPDHVRTHPAVVEAYLGVA